MFGKKQLDFLAIGDITTDAFIRLKDPHIHAEVNNAERELCMTFGTKIPYEFVEIVRAVGNSSNAAVSAARLGLNSGLATNIGNDQNGRECLAVLKKEKVATDYVNIHKGMETNYHYVLWYEAERTILVKHQPYERKFPNVGNPKWLYLSSLGGNSESYHQEIASYLEKHPGIKLAFQPGTFQITLGAEKLKSLYARTEVFICNKEESQEILGIDSKEIKILLAGVRALGPKIVLITDGPAGAYLYEGDNVWFMPPYPDPKPPYNRTGAGDAYASTFVSALALGKTPDEALRLAPINSMAVVQCIGAQKGLLTRQALEDLLLKAPADYKISKI